MAMPILYNRDHLRPHEYNRLRNQLGGGFSIIDSLLYGAVGSPLLQYVSGHKEIDTLNSRCSDQLRINIELLKSGVFIWVAERTRSYFFSLPYGSFFVEQIQSPADNIHYSIHLADGQSLEVKMKRQKKKAWDKFIYRIQKMTSTE